MQHRAIEDKQQLRQQQEPPSMERHSSGSNPRWGQARSLQQILTVLEREAQGLDLGRLLQPALVVWLNTQKMAELHLHTLDAASAIQAAQAALHAAPLCHTPQQRLDWCKQYVPRFIKELIAHVEAQTGVNVKRMQVLQQLLASQGESVSEKLAARLKEEKEKDAELSIAIRVALLLAPLATLVKALGGYWDAACQGTARTGQRCKLICSYQQGDALLGYMADDLRTQSRHLLQLYSKLDQRYLAVMTPQGALTSRQQVRINELGHFEQVTLCLQALANMGWLNIALSLAPTDKHDAARAWVEVVQWGVLVPALKHEILSKGDFQSVICGILARPDLNQGFLKDGTQRVTCEVLHAYGVLPEHLKASGVSEAVLQKLLPVLQEEHSKGKTKNSNSNAASCKQDGSADDGHGTARAAAAAADDDDDDDDRSFDMKELLDMMYGTTNITG